MYCPFSSVAKNDDELTACRKHIQVLQQILNFVSVMASGLMIWKGLGLLTNTESPIVVVLRYLLRTNLPGNARV